MSRTMLWLITAAVMLVSVVIGAMLVKQPWSQASELSESDLQQKVLEQYSGEIKDTRIRGGQYEVELLLDSGRYELSLDRSSGVITSIIRLTDGSIPAETAPSRTPGITPPAAATAAPAPSTAATPLPASTPKPVETAAPVSSTPSVEPTLLLTEEQAVQAALTHIPGTAEGVERDSSGHYLVEIDLEDGREAIVQVNKISGAVMSVAWDDDDDDNDDDG